MSDENKQPRPYPDLLSSDEQKAILARAEQLWADLLANNLGGFSGINRPFWIVAELKAVIEEFGRRDVGLRWSKDDLDAASQPVSAINTDDDRLREAREIAAQFYDKRDPLDPCYRDVAHNIRRGRLDDQDAVELVRFTVDALATPCGPTADDRG